MDLIVAHFLALNIMAERWSVVGQSTAKHRGSHLPCCGHACMHLRSTQKGNGRLVFSAKVASSDSKRSEEHTSELQSRLNLVCRLLLEKKKKSNATIHCMCYV